MKVLHYEEQSGKINGWYDKLYNKDIPTPNIELDNETWQKAINENANHYDVLTNILSIKDLRTQEEILKQEIIVKMQEAKTYLDDTDFKMLVDYFSTLEEAKKQELIRKRAEARDYIRANEQ